MSKTVRLKSRPLRSVVCAHTFPIAPSPSRGKKMSVHHRRTNWVTARSRWAPSTDDDGDSHHKDTRPTDACAVCGLLLVDGAIAMDFFSCVRCDTDLTGSFWIGCVCCVRSRWPAANPKHFPGLLVTSTEWTVGCPRCEPKHQPAK